MTREQTQQLLDELQQAGLIGYQITATRPGEYGPHLDIWKGPRFSDRLALGSVSQRAQTLFEHITSGEIQQLVDAMEPTASRHTPI